MFSEKFLGSLLTSREDEDFFKHLKFWHKRDSQGEDMSMEATVRAILGNRVSEDFYISIGSEVCSTGDFCTDSRLVIYQTSYSERWLKAVTQYKSADFFEVSDLEDYLSKQACSNIKVFVNEGIKSSAVIINTSERSINPTKIYHLIQAFIPRYCPWFFVDKPLTDLETRFLKTLTEKSSAEYLRLLNEIAEGFGDRKKAFLKSQIGSLGKVLNEKRINGLKRTIENIQDKINDCQRQYSSLARDLQEQRIFLMGLESQAGTSDEMCKELLDYLQHNKHIRIEKVSPDTGWIRFVALGTLSIYDPDVLESMKRNGSLYRFKDRTAYVERVTNACFGDDAPFAIKVCARYEISLDGEVNVHSGEDYSNYPDYVPNPHIQRHACLGTYQNPIQSALLAGDPIQAIEQCLGSAQSVNLGESEITFYPFMREVFDSKNKIIQMPDGSSATLDEADEWLKKQEEFNV